MKLKRKLLTLFTCACSLLSTSCSGTTHTKFYPNKEIDWWRASTITADFFDNTLTCLQQLRTALVFLEFVGEGYLEISCLKEYNDDNKMIKYVAFNNTRWTSTMKYEQGFCPSLVRDFDDEDYFEYSYNVFSETAKVSVLNVTYNIKKLKSVRKYNFKTQEMEDLYVKTKN